MAVNWGREESGQRREMRESCSSSVEAPSCATNIVPIPIVVFCSNALTRKVRYQYGTLLAKKD